MSVVIAILYTIKYIIILNICAIYFVNDRKKKGGLVLSLCYWFRGGDGWR